MTAVDRTQPGSLAVGADSDECPQREADCLARPGLLDVAGNPEPMFAACANRAAWPIGYGRRLLTCTPCLCSSRSLAYWIRQVFAYLCLVLVPITPPGLLDMAGLGHVLLSTLADRAAWLIGYSRRMQQLVNVWSRAHHPRAGLAAWPIVYGRLT